MSAPLVSVVVPAYNAEATIDETLRSVRAQTHAALEILVVDDGSRDATAAIAERHAAEDGRIRVLRQDNAGVAAARNLGWQTARADLIAFVDADDLWAPEKIARQVEAMARGGEPVGLVYCWYAMIDADSRITFDRERPLWEGDVLDRLCQGNFVGNGSAALVRWQALIDAGGFEPGLRAAGAQGCEDILFYCRVARHHHFGVVPDHLVGYRVLPGNMSSDMRRMLRSWMLVIDEMGERCPERRGSLTAGLRIYYGWLVRRIVRTRQLGQFPGVVALMLRRRPIMAIAGLGHGVAQVAVQDARAAWRAHKRRRRHGPQAATPRARFAIGSIAA